MVRAVVVMATMVSLVTVSASSASAAATSLTVPGSTAFSVLGHWCGGISEHNYASGFDPLSGYPVGYSYVWTICNGSGRGGHSITYSDWLSMTWDFTGAMVGYSVISPPTVNPTLTVDDAHGNNLTNQNNNAYLTLASGFVPAPRVAGVSPTTAPQGTLITITGDGFTGATAVTFGNLPASYTVNSDTSITAVAPAVKTGLVDVTVAGAGGTSLVNPSDQFTYNLAPRVAGLKPARGSVDGGTKVTITGVNFTGATSVTFGGLPARYNVINNRTIIATSPTYQDPTIVVVVVASNHGYSATTTADQFTYTD
jgi:hypothetical protein